jgi:predicted permease
MTRGRRALDDLDRDIRDHIEREVQDNLARGLPPAEAWRRAMVAFGNVLLVKEDTRATWIPSWTEQLRQDLRFAARTFRRNPTFTAVAVLTLSLGIGMTTAMFNVISGVLLRPLAGRDADRLVQIVENVPAEESVRGVATRNAGMTQDEFVWWRTHAKSLQMAALVPETRTIVRPDGTVRLSGVSVSSEWFAINQIPPLLGRWLHADDERSGAQVALVNAAAWRRYFGGAPDILQRSLVLDGEPLSIVGVMPGESGDVEFWRPFEPRPVAPGATTFVGVSARLRDGATIEAATAEVNALGRFLRDIGPDRAAPPRFEVVRVQEQMVARVRPALRVLGVAVVVVLLIVCANVANLLLARGTTRASEITVRRALGAGRGRIIRQLLTESVLLSALGGVGGAVVATAGLAIVRPLAVYGLPERFRAALGPAVLDGGSVIPRLGEASIDVVVFACAFAVTLGAGLLCGMAPAIRLSRDVPARPAGENSSPGHESTRLQGTTLRSVLAASQLVLATMLLVVTGLLVHSFWKLSGIEMGFNPRVLTFELIAPGNYAPARRLALAHELVDALQSLPTVTAAGFVDRPPLSRMGNSWSGPVVPVDMEWRGLADEDRTMIRSGSSEYLRTLGVRLIAGQWLRPGGAESQEVIINSAYARRFLGAKNPLGATLRWGTVGTFRVVGVVDDMHWSVPMTPGEAPARFIFMHPRPSEEAPRPMFAVHVAGDPLALVPNLRGILRGIDPALAAEGITTLDDVLARLHTRPRFYAVLLGIFGSAAGFIAVIGVYGVLAYGVMRRTQEFGIRLALGAQRTQILRLVFHQATGLVLAGIGLGLVGALGMTQYLESMLFGLSPLDPKTYVAVACGFALVALVASYVPARRAMNIHPIDALRHE